MMDRHEIPIAKIYVPVKRLKMLEPGKTAALAEDILENGQTTPISVRAEPDRDRYVLVEGLHRLEAMKALGEQAITAFLVRARIR